MIINEIHGTRRTCRVSCALKMKTISAAVINKKYHSWNETVLHEMLYRPVYYVLVVWLLMSFSQKFANRHRSKIRIEILEKLAKMACVKMIA